MENMKFTPFSKKNVIYARCEAYVFSIILIIMVCCGKDVTAISILLSLSWGGYKIIQSLYIKMAEREHLEEIRQGRLYKSLDTSDIDAEINELETQDYESEIYDE